LDTTCRAGSLFVVVIDKYKFYDDLPRVRRAVAETVPALERLGFARATAELAPEGSWARLQTGFGERLPSGDGPVIIYWTGHGRLVDERGGLCLLCADSPASLVEQTVEAMTAARLGGLIARRRIGRTLLLIDACNAGGGALEVAQAFHRHRTGDDGDDADLGLAVITSARAGQAAGELVFSRALRKVLTEDGSAFHSRNETLTPDDLVRALRAAMREAGQTPDISTDGIVGDILLNPWHRPDQPDVLVESKVSGSAAIPAAGAAHFLIKFRGIDLAADQGWFFTGREHTWKLIRDWMDRPGSGVFVLTGSPGSGKSALLGRLAVLSDRDMRAAAVAAGAVDPALAAGLHGTGPLDAGLHARRMTLRDCVESFASALGVAASEPRALLREVGRIGAARAARGERSLVLMVDALDEAQRTDRRSIVADLLRPLANLPAVKVLVGLRRELPDRGDPEQAQLTSLLRVLADETDTVYAVTDDPQTESDIADYIVKRLIETDGSPYRTKPHAAAPVGAALARRCAGIFLPAQIFSRVLSHRGRVDDAATVAHSPLFSADLKLAFDEDLRRFDDQQDAVRLMLAPLAWAEGKGMPLREVWGAAASALRDLAWTGPQTGARPRLDADWISTLIDTAGAYLIEASEDGQAVYRLYHDEFARYLRGALNAESAQRTVTRALLALAGPPGQRDWAAANPYLRRHLAGHAAAAGLLGELIEDPAYLAYADPDRLTRALHGVDTDRHPLARLYLRVAHRLSGMPPGRRAELLQESALRDEPDLLGRLARLPGLTWRGIASSAPPRPFHRVLPGHAASVAVVGFAAVPGCELLVSRAGATVHVWDLAAAERVQTINRLRSPRLEAAVGSADGRALLALAEPAGVGCWDVLTAERLGRWYNPGGAVRSLAFGKLDGRGVLAVAAAGRVDLVRPGEGDCVRRIPAGPVRQVAATDTDGAALVATAGDAVVEVWDAATAQRIGAFPARGSSTCLALRTLPHGYAVAVGYTSGLIHYSEGPVARARELSGHAGRQVLSLAFADSGTEERLLVSGAADGGAVLWDAASGACRQLQERAGRVTAVAARGVAGDALIATGGENGDVRLWENPSLARIDADAAFAPIPGLIRAVALAPDPAAAIAVGTDTGVLQVRAAACALVREADLGDRPVSALACDGAALAAATTNGRIYLWPDGVAGKRIAWTGSVNYIHALQIDSGRDLLLSAGADGVVRTWSMRTGDPVAALRLDGLPVRALASAPPTGSVTAAVCGRSVFVWSSQAGGRPTRLAVCDQTLQSIALGSLDGVCVAAAGDVRGRITLLDTAHSRVIRTFDGHSDGVHALALGELGAATVLASASDGSVRLWDARSGAELDRWTEGESGTRIRAAAFRFDGDRLLRVSATGHAVTLAYAGGPSHQPRPGM
jgi:WD40 repeat protein